MGIRVADCLLIIFVGLRHAFEARVLAGLLGEWRGGGVKIGHLFYWPYGSVSDDDERKDLNQLRHLTGRYAFYE